MTQLYIRPNFPKHLVDLTEEIGEVNPILEATMAKTLALFFVLGLMVSCASYHNERTISSVDKHEKEQHNYHFDRFMR